ncbi:hypothetical protein [Hymenobacter sp. IS2118]|uniref:hypothetical protein n=1 Tax=Hymenobacter sp. IS2118 TaxID=1505605 RepID=UPI001267F10D|nr:hypothetical protein [Hymenobacter sp. IS2118]
MSHRLVSVMLAVLVLTTSVGLTVQRLTCNLSGRSMVAVSVPGRADLRGCTEELVPATSQATDNCCDFSQQVHKLSVAVHELVTKVLLLAPLPATVAALELAWPAGPALVFSQTTAPRWFAADSSPPLGGRGLLVFVCTLVV